MAQKLVCVHCKQEIPEGKIYSLRFPDKKMWCTVECFQAFGKAEEDAIEAAKRAARAGGGQGVIINGQWVGL